MNLLNHPVHASRTIFVIPKNVGMFFIVNTRSEKQPAGEAVMSAADECAWHRPLKTPDSSAPNNGGLAGTELLVPNQVTLFSKTDDFETGRRGDGEERRQGRTG